MEDDSGDLREVGSYIGDDASGSMRCSKGFEISLSLFALHEVTWAERSHLTPQGEHLPLIQDEPVELDKI